MFFFSFFFFFVCFSSSRRRRFQERLLEGRLFFSCSKGYPVAVSSVIHYKPKEEEDRRMHQKRIDELGAEVFKILKRRDIITPVAPCQHSTA